MSVPLCDFITDSVESHPPAAARSHTECRSQDHSDCVIKDDIMVKVKKQSGSIIEDQVLNVKELDSSIADRAYLHVTGMSCASCVNSIETNVIKKPGEYPHYGCYVITGCYVGVYDVRVGLLAEKAEIVYNPNLTDPDTLVRHVQDLGFGAELLVHEAPTEHKLDLIVSRTPHYIVLLMVESFIITGWRDDLCIMCALD